MRISKSGALVDDASNAASGHRAPPTGVGQPATRRSHEAMFDQLKRIQGGQQLGAVETLEAAGRQPAVEHVAIEVHAAIQAVPLTQDLHVGLIHQPDYERRLPMLMN